VALSHVRGGLLGAECRLGEAVAHVTLSFAVDTDPDALLSALQPSSLRLEQRLKDGADEMMRWLDTPAASRPACQPGACCWQPLGHEVDPLDVDAVLGRAAVRAWTVCEVKDPLKSPSASPDNWVSTAGPNGRRYWHNLSLGPAPWEELDGPGDELIVGDCSPQARDAKMPPATSQRKQETMAPAYQSLDEDKRLLEWAARLEIAVAGASCAQRGVAALFHESCHWRDLVLFTWDIRTFEGRPAVASALAATACAAGLQPGAFTLRSRSPKSAEQEEAEDPAAGRIRHGSRPVSGWLNVSTKTARGTARVHLHRGDDGADRCSVLFTSMSELKGFEEATGPRRPCGHATDKAASEAEHRCNRTAAAHEEPYVLIIGGSQSGLMLAARLKNLQVPTLVVDKLAKPGDSWRNRYNSLHLHDPIWVCHMPYLPFPSHFPVYLSKDRYADWLDTYRQVMDINFQGGTAVTHASYSASKEEWEVEVRRGGETSFVRPKHVVFATGSASMPSIPSFPGLESFQGPVLHSSQFAGCEADDPAWKGKRCVIVGSNTSAHDVAQDLCEHGAEVTMLQRSATCVLKTQRIREMCAGGGYSEEAEAGGMDVEQADLQDESMPYVLREAAFRGWVQGVKEQDAKYYQQLQEVGWQQDWGEDGTGPYMMFIRKFCGYYFDIGASQLLIDGRVSLQPRAEIAEVRPRTVVLTNGTELACDMLVLATGYKGMTDWLTKLISPETAKAVGPIWGLGSGLRGDPGPYDGELRNMWKPTAQPGLWFHGGNIKLSRFFSLHLALQLKARYEKLPVKEVPGGWISHRGAEGRLFWHHADLGPAPWETPGLFPATPFAAQQAEVVTL
ncbi:unnamed protein product, partial [Polarella glacialis]